MQAAFELSVLGYQLERFRLPEGEVSDAMKHIALYGALRNDPESREEDPGTPLDQIDRAFVEFTITTANEMRDNDINSTWFKRLVAFGHHLADPTLQRRVTEVVQSLQTRLEEKRRPAGRIARIAYENWQDDPDGPKIVS